MDFLGRSRELGVVRTALDDAGGGVFTLDGPRGIGKSALADRATTGRARVWCSIPPLPQAYQQEALARALAEARHAALPDDATAGVARADERAGADEEVWRRLFDRVTSVPGGGASGAVLVLDDAHHLTSARSSWRGPLLASIVASRRRGRSLHVLLSGRSPGVPSSEELAAVSTGSLTLGPLPFRAAAAALPGSRPRDVVRAYAVFGGIPRVLEHLDRSVTVGTNVRRLLEEDGPLATLGHDWIERSFQTPTRYYAIMSTLSRGEADWATVHGGVPDLTQSGQLAPYLQKLEDVGLVQVRRSLDASPAGRSRRYRCADPFVAFWFRYLFPRRFSDRGGDAGAYYAETIRPSLGIHVHEFFDEICRHFMTHDAIEVLGANARECGSLWGPGYDIAVAGTLSSGPAFYGVPRWDPDFGDPDPLSGLEAGIRRTRYGFGRQTRLRILFSGRELPAGATRRILRREDGVLVGPSELLGIA